jgi:hypothetical protein
MLFEQLWHVATFLAQHLFSMNIEREHERAALLKLMPVAVKLELDELDK